jgi:hypothetical protein
MEIIDRVAVPEFRVLDESGCRQIRVDRIGRSAISCYSFAYGDLGKATRPVPEPKAGDFMSDVQETGVQTLITNTE